jgi:hypothetical protein
LSYKRASQAGSNRRSSARQAWLGLPVALVIASLTFVACGTERPNAATEHAQPPVFADVCATPNEGCECLEPGKKVECGTVKATSADGYVACSMGERQCIGGHWGACIGETDVVKPRTFVAAGGPIGTQALGNGVPCGSVGGGPGNPCDPYCNAFVDDPVGLILDGGLVVSDGGLTVGPSADASLPDGGTAGFQSTAGGVSTCAGGNNLVGPACTPPGLTTCQQDFRCDPASNKCAWNGGAGYYDPTVAGIDLTVGAPCGPSGSGAATAPVCNRGSGTVPAGSTITFHVTTGSTPPDGCSNLGTPTLVNTLPAALGPGQCTNFTLGNSTGNKMITINAGSPGAVTEAAGRCANNSAYFKDDGAPGCGACGVCNTVVTGKVYDPSGPTPGNNVPLAGVTVFQPAGTLLPFVDGVACESCAGLDSAYITKAVTDAAGSFTLTGVTPGTNIPIVVQSGRWRRKIELPTVTACTTLTPAAGTFRMPKNRTDGLGGVADIPRTALVTSDNESLECLLLKIGISSTEFAPYTTAAPQRIRMFRNNGLTMTGIPAAVPGVFNALNEHTQTIFDCDGAGVFSSSPLWTSTTAAQKQALQTYTSNGGKVFMDHLPGQLFLTTGPAPFNSVSTWNTTLYQQTGFDIPAKGKVLTGTGPQATFLSWLQNVGAMTDYGSPLIRSDVPRRHSLNPSAATTTWIRGETSNNWAGNPGGNYALSFSFEMGKVGTTPTLNAECGVTDGHGRVMFNGMHVAQTRTPYPASGTFPGACNLGFALTPEEKALEYQLFQLTACQLGGATPPPPPPPPVPLPVVNYQRDYQAVCGPGERVKWGPLYWQSVIPPGTSISFRAATADTVAALPSSPPAGAPTTAAVGTANATVLAPAWDCTGCSASPPAPVTVDSQLQADTMKPSAEFLRVFMRFTPTATVPPTLLSWRQVYDCVPAE